MYDVSVKVIIFFCGKGTDSLFIVQQIPQLFVKITCCPAVLLCLPRLDQGVYSIGSKVCTPSDVRCVLHRGNHA